MTQLIYELPLKPYTFKRLCEIYDLSPKTMRLNLSKLKAKLGPQPAEIYDINQVITIIKYLDTPAPYPANDTA